jgi:hypothetical protein
MTCHQTVKSKNKKENCVPKSLKYLSNDELLRLVYSKAEPSGEELELAERLDSALNDVSDLNHVLRSLANANALERANAVPSGLYLAVDNS